jgi:hypothetical protein
MTLGGRIFKVTRPNSVSKFGILFPKKISGSPLGYAKKACRKNIMT